MIQYPGSYETTWIFRCLLIISITFVSACENDEIIKPQAQSEPAEPPLQVREWYPAAKHRQQPAVYAPVPAAGQQPVRVPAYQGNVAQQPWSVTAPQPVYQAPLLVYQPPPVTQYQQPQGWAGQQYVAPLPQPVVPQYQYQYVPRPWGGVTAPNSNQNPAVSTETWPQSGYITPWGVPATGYTGQVPGTVYYGHEW